MRIAADTDDLVQVVLERALSKQTQADEIENIAGWLVTIARNAVLDHQRLQQRSRAAASPGEASEPDADGATSSSEREEALACKSRSPASRHRSCGSASE